MSFALCGKPNCTPQNPCGDCKLAIVERCLDTKEGTAKLYREAHLPVPTVIADTKLGRIQQFYIIIGHNPKS